MNKPVTAQELIDWIVARGEKLEQDNHWAGSDDAFEVAMACRMFLKEMENGT